MGTAGPGRDFESRSASREGSYHLEGLAILDDVAGYEETQGRPLSVDICKVQNLLYVSVRKDEQEREYDDEGFKAVSPEEELNRGDARDDNNQYHYSYGEKGAEEEDDKHDEAYRDFLHPSQLSQGDQNDQYLEPQCLGLQRWEIQGAFTSISTTVSSIRTIMDEERGILSLIQRTPTSCTLTEVPLGVEWVIVLLGCLKAMMKTVVM